MASQKGFVQELKVTTDNSMAWVYVGPSPLYTEVLFIELSNGLSQTEAALAASMIDTLASCLVERREVEVFHGSNDGRLTAVKVHPV